MKVDTMRFIDRWAGIPLSFLFSFLVWFFGLFRFGRKRTDVSRTLFIELSEMGSAILVDPAMRRLRDEGKAELDKLVDKLNSSKEYDIVIGGHTCNIGTDDYNMKLSEKRAQAVVKYLLMKGVNNAYVGSNNYGESKPAVENTTIKNKKLNRRAEFEVAKIRK